ncbi:hypothetical protein [Roseofilum sp. SBFL]|uniref:hypothetical protein n=1 Tax=Roseofilum sp. SBFL TaxID=2821496 RepID=UPI00298DA0E9|nr:hypothetical protein [Roseofilum sp. SBFL]
MNNSEKCQNIAIAQEYTAQSAVMVYPEEKEAMEELMKAYSLDLREKIVKAHLVEKYSIRQVSARLSVSKN